MEWFWNITNRVLAIIGYETSWSLIKDLFYNPGSYEPFASWANYEVRWDIVLILTFTVALIIYLLAESVTSKSEEMSRIRTEVKKYILFNRDHPGDHLIRSMTYSFFGAYSKRIEIELRRSILVRLFLGKDYQELSRMYRELKEI